MSELPTGWVETTLGNYAYVKNGFAFKSKDYITSSNDTVPVIRISDINGITASDKKAVHVDKSKVQDGFEVKKNDFLIAMSGATTGKTGIYISEGLAYQNQRVGNIKLINNELGCSSYKNYLILNMRDSILDKAYGAAQPNISGSAIEKLLVPIAPLNEQIQIANKLDSILAKVETTQKHLDKIPTLLKRFRQSVLASAVSGELTNTEESEDYSLGEVALVQTGSTPLKSNTLYYDNGDIPWLTSTVTGQSLVTSSDKFVTKLAVKECRLKLFPAGTLLVAMYGEGKTRGQVTETAIEATINQACAAITVDESFASKSFVKMCIENNYEQTRLMAEGGAQPNLNLTKVRSIPIQLPNHKEQKQIVKRVEVLFTLADKVEQHYQAAKQRTDRLTQSILAKAFRGELVPQDPNDEPASELLKRIKEQRIIELVTKSKTVQKRITKPKLKKVKPMTLSEAPEKYLSSFLFKMDSKALAKDLWNKSEMSIDDFYCQLKSEIEMGIIKEEKSSDPSQRFLLIAN